MSLSLPLGDPGAIGSYSALVTEIAAWLDRDDLTARIPGFIRLAEARLNDLLRCPEMEKITTLYAVTGDTNLPTDFLAMRGIYLDTTPNGPLRAMAPDALIEDYTGTAGIPLAYSIVGRTLRLAPPPASPCNIKMLYFGRIPSLTDAAPSNWLLTMRPDLYLWGTLLAASAFIEDGDHVGQWKAAYDEALAERMKAGNKSRYGAGPLVPNTVRQTKWARA